VTTSLPECPLRKVFLRNETRPATPAALAFHTDSVMRCGSMSMRRPRTEVAAAITIARRRTPGHIPTSRPLTRKTEHLGNNVVRSGLPVNVGRPPRRLLPDAGAAGQDA